MVNFRTILLGFLIVGVLGNSAEHFRIVNISKRSHFGPILTDGRVTRLGTEIVTEKEKVVFLWYKNRRFKSKYWWNDMSTRINTPVFTKSKPYERYRQELRAWREITDLPKSKQGVVIALSLPEDEAIREKVFDQLDLAELKKDNGFELLEEFLDIHLGKDDLADALQKFEEFEDCCKLQNESMREFVERFDSRYRKIEKLKMKLPSEIIAFKLLRMSKITKEEKLLVLTGMNFDEKESLFAQAKTSLLKFKGDIGIVSDVKHGTTTGIKLEPAYVTEEAYWTRSKPNRGRRSQSFGRSAHQHRQRPTENFRPASHSLSRERKINPTGANGRIYTCRACGSYRHFIKDCPDSWEKLESAHITEEDEHVVLFTGNIHSENNRLAFEARNCAVLDSACSGTVCGQTWFNSYVDSLSDDDQRKIVKQDSKRHFRFGGGTILPSLGEYVIPAYIAGIDMTIRTDVVESDIPLLLSRTAMKRAKVKLDLINDTAEIMGKEIVLNSTSSGHYCVPIDKMSEIPVESVCCTGELLDRKTLIKLHRQFAHPPENRLIALLKDAGVWRDEFKDDLASIHSDCVLCKMYAKTPPRPVVALPMAKSFNQKVAMDLKQWSDKLWILHMIDMWSRYTVSTFVKRKKTSDIIDALMVKWVSVFGVMQSLMTDNGGEFNSEELREISSILNIKVCTTAGYSPFQNGLCERVHAITDSMPLKLEAENKGVDLETLLSWANMAKNALQMWNGYSSHQLVFGQNPNLPNVMNDKLPGLEGVTSSEVFAKHLNSLHSARTAFIKSEADERIRRALRSKVRAAEQVFQNGDAVFYKRDGKEKWLGPGKVVFQDGKVIFIRHGGVFVRVSPNRLTKVVNEESGNDTSRISEEVDSKKENSNEIEENVQTIVTEFIPKASLPVQNEKNYATKKPGLKKDDEIRFRNEDTWYSGRILSRASKASSKNPRWYNVRLNDGGEISVDFDSVEWENIEDVNVVTMRPNEKTQIHLLAKQEELEKLKSFHTYDEVVDDGQTVISTRWVVVQKDTGVVKARLVARGFEEENDMKSDSPTVSKDILRLFLTIASHRQWTVKTTDIKSAFLQGQKLERDVYIAPPPEANCNVGVIWKLNHCLYGLNDGARQFYLSVKQELVSKLGCVQSTLDPALFIFKNNEGSLIGMICLHVDDFLHAGEMKFDKNVMDKLRERFCAGKVEEGDFTYVGFQIKNKNNCIVIDQTAYVDNLENGVLCTKRASMKNELLSKSEQTLFRQLIGRLNWAVRGSRPDMAFETIELSTKLKSGVVGDLCRSIKAIRKMKEIQAVICFPKLGPVNGWRFVLHSDASHANICDGAGSMGAYVIWIVDDKLRCCPISWQANKIKRVVRSTIAAEALALQEGLEACYYYKNVLAEVIGPINIKIIAFVDNKSVVDAVYSTKLVDDKRLRIDIAAIQESLRKGEVSRISWCPTSDQLADCMTKKGAVGYKLLQVLERGIFISEGQNNPLAEHEGSLPNEC